MLKILKKSVIPLLLLCLISLLVPLTHVMSDQIYNVQQATHAWTHHWLKVENEAVDYLKTYLHQQNDEGYEKFQRVLHTLEERIDQVNDIFDPSIDEDQVASEAVSPSITSEQQRLVTRAFRMGRNFEAIQNARNAWNSMTEQINKLKKTGTRIHTLKQNGDFTEDSLSRYTGKLEATQASLQKAEDQFLKNTNKALGWFESMVWWVAYGLLFVLFCVSVGITLAKTKRSERRKRELSDLFGNTPLPIARLDGQAKIKSVNMSFTELFGYSEKELTDHHIDRFIVPEDKHEEAEKFNMASLANQTVTERTERIDKDGNIINVAVSAFPIKINGKTTGIYAIYQDITDIVRMNRQLEQSVHQKQTLLEEIHHRVKNNLAVISGLLYLKSESTEIDGVHESLIEAQNRIQSMALIHEQLYQEADENARIDMSQYLKDLVSSIEQSHNEIETTIDTHVNVNPIKLPLKRSITVGLLTTELINNAFKHAFEGRDEGEIHVEMHKENGDIQLTISDDGIGLPEDFQLQDGSMGMQILINLSNQLDGEIVYDSKPDEGSRFTVTFEEGQGDSKSEN